MIDLKLYHPTVNTEEPFLRLVFRKLLVGLYASADCGDIATLPESIKLTSFMDLRYLLCLFLHSHLSNTLVICPLLLLDVFFNLSYSIQLFFYNARIPIPISGFEILSAQLRMHIMLVAGRKEERRNTGRKKYE